MILQEATVGGDLAFPLVEATSSTPSSFAASKADQYICELEEIDREGNRNCLKRRSDKTIHTAKHVSSLSLDTLILSSSFDRIAYVLETSLLHNLSILPKCLGGRVG